MPLSQLETDSGLNWESVYHCEVLGPHEDQHVLCRHQDSKPLYILMSIDSRFSFIFYLFFLYLSKGLEASIQSAQMLPMYFYHLCVCACVCIPEQRNCHGKVVDVLYLSFIVSLHSVQSTRRFSRKRGHYIHQE